MTAVPGIRVDWDGVEPMRHRKAARRRSADLDRKLSDDRARDASRFSCFVYLGRRRQQAAIEAAASGSTETSSANTPASMRLADGSVHESASRAPRNEN
jgi:hypothetical protein